MAGEKERELGFQLGSGIVLAMIAAPPPNVHEATIAHKEMAAISLS